MRHGGQILIQQLKIQDCQRVFCVPGKYLTAALDGLYDNAKIQTITCRQELGAVLMAQALGKLCMTPGICFVSGATGVLNAANGVHLANQASTPLILFVGLPSDELLDRQAIQCIDLKSLFQDQAKLVEVIYDIKKIPEHISRAYNAALSGRPGPVVIGLPQNVLEDRGYVEDCKSANPAQAAPSLKDIGVFRKMLHSANRPIMIVGGPGWSNENSQKVLQFSEDFEIPVATAFGCNDYIDNQHKNYVGNLGVEFNPLLQKRINGSDLVIALGTSLDDITTSNYTLLKVPNPSQQLIHIHPAPDKTGRVYHADLAITATNTCFCDLLSEIGHLENIHWAAWTQSAHKDYLEFLKPVTSVGEVKLEYIVWVLTELLPKNSLITNGLGSSTHWLHRYFQYKSFGTQLSPMSGIQGYGLPAAISAKLEKPDLPVVAFVGDGCFMSTCAEMATAMQYGLRIIIIVVNNRMYGGARKQQETNYPGRVLGTSLTNPSFYTTR